MKENIVFEKSKKFAVKIVNLYKIINYEKKEFVLSKQILKSGTSIGANIAEANCGISKKDFLAKMYIAFKECSETLYWLDLLSETGIISKTEYQSLKSDCLEVQNLLSAITETTKKTISNS